MALNAAIQMSTNSCVAGATPVPTFSLVVGNPNAAAIVVTNVDIYFTDPQGNAIRPAASPVVPPIGQGQPTTVAANGSTTLGPMSLGIGSAANANSFQMVPPGATPANPQGALPAQQQIFVHARVYGSDGSINEAAPGGILVSPALFPPPASQGGYVQFAGPNNACLIAAVL